MQSCLGHLSSSRVPARAVGHGIPPHGRWFAAKRYAMGRRLTRRRPASGERCACRLPPVPQPWPRIDPMALERIVVVGASLAGLRSVEALRRLGYAGRMTLVGAEPHLPYDRPPLSKEVLAGKW